MGRCYSGDHIARDHIHTDITTCNIGEPQQKYRLGTVSNRLLAWEVRGGGDLIWFTGYKPLLLQKLETFGFLTHKCINTVNKQITDKNYDESPLI